MRGVIISIWLRVIRLVKISFFFALLNCPVEICNAARYVPIFEGACSIGTCSIYRISIVIARYSTYVAINKGSICREAKIPAEGAAHLEIL